MLERRRRAITMVAGLVVIFVSTALTTLHQQQKSGSPNAATPPLVLSDHTGLAYQTLVGLEVKGRAPKTGYAREQFGAGWATVDGCDMRNYILQRDLVDTRLDREDNCTVLSGTLHDPYTGKTIAFQRGAGTSQAVQIDHVVALSDAWQKGAQQLDEARRAEFANDPLNLLAVDGPANNKKSDSDAATWLPSNKGYRCRYVTRQVAVKQKYRIWVTMAERDAMTQVLQSCPDQILPG